MNKPVYISLYDSDNAVCIYICTEDWLLTQSNTIKPDKLSSKRNLVFCNISNLKTLKLIDARNPSLADCVRKQNIFEI